MEGPNAINALVDVLLICRSLEWALTSDPRKAYQTIWIGDLENNLRRFVWCESKNEPWKGYSFVRVNFGDGISALIIELSQKVLADAGSSIDHIAAKQLRRNGYIRAQT